MDILHHSAIGFIGFSVAVANDQTMAGLFFLIGNVVPDLDALLVLFGRSFYLKNHQGFSHSLFLAPLFALLILTISLLFTPFSWVNFMALMLGFFTHSFLDYLNSYGIMLFYPLIKKRYALDSVFFIDATLLLLTATMLYFEYSIWLYFGLYLLYIVFKILIHKVVVKQLKVDFAIPSALNPFDFYIYNKENEKIETYSYNLLLNKKRNQTVQENLNKKFSHLTEKSQLFNDIRQVTKALHICKVEESENETIIVAKDLAVRNFGAKFATTTVKFNKKGELIYEHSNI